MADETHPHLWIPADRVRSEQFQPHGGGRPFQRDDMAEHGERLLARYRSAYRRAAETDDAPVTSKQFLQVRTAESRPVKAEVTNLAAVGLRVVAFSHRDPALATVQVRKADVERLDRMVERYATTSSHRGKSYFAAIEEIELVPIEEKIDDRLLRVDPDLPIPCIISLYSVLTREEEVAVSQRIGERLRRHRAGDVTTHRFPNGVVALTAALDRGLMFEMGASFASVRSIEEDEEVLSESSVILQPLPPAVQVGPPKYDAPVVVIDSGINPNSPLLAPLVAGVHQHLPSGAVGPHYDHGTFVASRAAYGDTIATIRSGNVQPYCSLIDVQVTGVDPIGQRVLPRNSDLSDALADVVPRLANEARVYNLSLGTGCVSPGRYSAVARVIDHLAHEHDVLFVVAAGNVGSPAGAPPAHYTLGACGITTPSESLLGVAVGSVAKFFEAGCDVPAGCVSAFSRHGPGADGGTKPDLVAHGGNSVYRGPGLPWDFSPRVAAYGISMDGLNTAYAIGTSYAAPLVAQYASCLFDAYRGASSNLIRALLYHFAKPVDVPPGVAIDPNLLHGFGEPAIDLALEATADRAVYLYEGAIRTNTYQYVPFFVPQAFATQGTRSRLRIRATIVYDPPVNPDDDVEYSRARLSATLRKHMPVGYRGVQLSGSDGYVLQPWNPVIQFQKTFRRGFASGDWDIRVRLMTRRDTDSDYEQKFAVVIEVIDEEGTFDVQGAILAENPAYTLSRLRTAA